MSCRLSAGLVRCCWRRLPRGGNRGTTPDQGRRLTPRTPTVRSGHPRTHPRPYAPPQPLTRGASQPCGSRVSSRTVICPMNGCATDQRSGASPTRGPGRPRKWTDNAERARAYRQRKASEQADADQLRRDRRNLRRRVARLTEALRREERRRCAAERRADRLADEVEALRIRLDRLQTLVSIEATQRAAQAEQCTKSHFNVVAPNRAARRRAARKRRDPAEGIRPS